MEDLQQALQNFIEAGDQIILMLEGNCNMRDSNLQRMLNGLTMNEIILQKHGLQRPATSKRNTLSVPIDGIWATPGVTMEVDGYFAFDEVVLNTDHRCLRIDITFVNAFGHTMPPLFRPKARRLHFQDPRLVDNFIYLYHKHATKYNLFNRVMEFDQNYKYLSLEEVQQEYEVIDQVRCKVTATAELKCRKLRKGNVAFSPTLNAARLLIKAWSLLLQTAKGGIVSSRLIARTLKKVQLPSAVRGYSIEKVNDNLKLAYKEYHVVKGDAAELRRTALDNLAKAIAEKDNSTQVKALKDLRRREAQRASAKKIRFIQGKLRTGSTTMVTIIDSQGQCRELSDKKILNGQS